MMRSALVLLGLVWALSIPPALSSPPTAISASVTADGVCFTEMAPGLLRQGLMAGKVESTLSWDGGGFNASLSALASGNLMTSYAYGWQAAGFSSIGFSSASELAGAHKWLSYALKASGKGVAGVGYAELRGWDLLFAKYVAWGRWSISFNATRVAPISMAPNATRPVCPSVPVP